MEILDIILLVVLIFGFVKGIMNGLFVELASILSLIFGVYGAIHFSYYVAGFLNSKTEWNEKTINILAFIITFIVIILAIIFAGKAFTKLADFATLGTLNKILGGVFGTFKLGLILSVLMIVFEKANDTFKFVEQEELNQSTLYQPVKSIAPLLFPDIIKSSKEVLEEKIEDLQG
mgnify:CR=1 FL=1